MNFETWLNEQKLNTSKIRAALGNDLLNESTSTGWSYVVVWRVLEEAGVPEKEIEAFLRKHQNKGGYIIADVVEKYIADRNKKSNK